MIVLHNAFSFHLIGGEITDFSPPERKKHKKRQRIDNGGWSLSGVVDKILAIHLCIKMLEQLTKVHYFLVNANISIYFAIGI